MSNGWIGGQIAKLLTARKRPRSFWNILFSCLTALVLLCGGYFVYQMWNGAEEQLVAGIIALALLVCPLLGFCIFMLIVTNIKKPSKRIDKIQRTYLLRMHKTNNQDRRFV